MVAVRAWIFALLASLLVLLPNGAPLRAEHYCRMLGRVVASCCCENDVTAAPAAPGAAQQVQLEGCCQRVSAPHHSARSAPLGGEKAVRLVAPAALAATHFALPEAESSGCTGGQCNECTQAPLAIGPPLFVRHCALLS